MALAEVGVPSSRRRALALPGDGRRVKARFSALICRPASGTPPGDGAARGPQPGTHHHPNAAMITVPPLGAEARVRGSAPGRNAPTYLVPYATDLLATQVLLRMVGLSPWADGDLVRRCMCDFTAEGAEPHSEDRIHEPEGRSREVGDCPFRRLGRGRTRGSGPRPRHGLAGEHHHRSRAGWRAVHDERCPASGRADTRGCRGLSG